MARKPSPWFWAERRIWMVTIKGTRHNLGEHPKGAPKPQKSRKSGQWNTPSAIADAFHKLMGKDRKVVSHDSVAAVLDDFQTFANENNAPRTAARYADFLQDFIHSCGLVPVSDLTADHVTQWLKKKKTWNSTTKRNAITALQRAFNWAVRNKGLGRNPIQGMEKPEAKRRTTIVAAAEFELILTHVTDQAFKDLLILSYDSGARPQEIKRLEARHIQADKHRAVIPTEEGKGGLPRAIYFPTDRSMEIIRRLAAAHPIGPLLLNKRGNPWTGFAVKNRMEDLEVKIGHRLRHYDLRRTFITDKIKAGVDSHIVAALSGHKSTAMIDRHYSAIGDDSEFMLSMARKQKSPASLPGKEPATN